MVTAITATVIVTSNGVDIRRVVLPRRYKSHARRSGQAGGDRIDLREEPTREEKRERVRGKPVRGIVDTRGRAA